MKSPLEALPVELVEWIARYLEPCDVASLRLTSHTLEQKFTQNPFNALFKHKKIELKTTTLQKFVRVTSQGRLSCLLEHCTISGIVRSAAIDDDEDPDKHSRLLAEAFRNLKQNNSNAGLASICLRVDAPMEEHDGKLKEDKGEKISGLPASPPWRAIWNMALRTFNVTMAALNESQLPVWEHLDIFSSLRACSLTRDAFLSFAQELTSKHVFGSLKRLTVSLSGTPIPKEQEYNPDSDNEDFTPVDPQELMRVSHINPLEFTQVLRRIMPELESLELHWYDLVESMSTVPSAIRQESHKSSASAGDLKECSLHGIYVSESDLFGFLEIAHPIKLTLTNIHLTVGTYASIFQYMTGPASQLTYYHLDDLREGYKLVHYDGVLGKPKFPYRGNRMGPSTTTRHDVTEEIRYQLPSGRPLGSGERYRWCDSKIMEFGPPTYARYGFNILNSNKTPDLGSPLDESRPFP